MRHAEEIFDKQMPGACRLARVGSGGLREPVARKASTSRPAEDVFWCSVESEYVKRRLRAVSADAGMAARMRDTVTCVRSHALTMCKYSERLRELRCLQGDVQGCV